MKTIIQTSLLLICFLFAINSQAQEKKFEFNKITPADFNAVSSSDTSADAVVIADVGETHFDYGPKGFYIIFQRKTRIHILKPGGTHFATVLIPLYKNDRNKETVASFKGYTYNLVNGEVVKTKVRNEDMFLEEESENWNQQKVAMPAVTANSVVEYEYTTHSEFLFNLQPWTFQDEIPVKWSEYTVKILEYFNFKKLSQGYIGFDVNETSTSTQRIIVYVESSIEPGLNQQREPAHTDTYNPSVTEYHWVAKNVPALKPEPFITTVKDYLSGIEFELATVKMPGRLPENVMDTWETMNQKLLENENFGRAVKKGNFISDKLPSILANCTTDVEKTKAIFDHVKTRMKWNGNNGIYTSNPLRKVYDERTGSAAEINLMMIAILNEAGIKTDPVILSTRTHGRIPETVPVLAKFNYVVALAHIDTSSFFLDATSNYIPFNTLPERCLNGNGRVISKENYGPIQLLNAESKYDFSQADFTMNADGSMTGTCIISSKGLSGNTRRNSYFNKNEKEFIKEFADQHNTWIVNSFEKNNLDTIEKPFIEKYLVEIPDGAQLAGDHMYLNVMAGMGEKDNPFKLEKRVYPVDFSCPMKESNFIRITIPEGWTVESLPKPSIISLPDNAGSFKFLMQQDKNIIQIISNLQINKTLFLPDDYEQLKEFFRLIVTKHAEQIVLKKA